MLAYSAGQVDDGVVVPSSFAFPVTRYALEEISNLGCHCGWIAYGLGLKGAGNLVPKLTGSGCPEPGAPIAVHLSNAVGGAPAALFVGLAPSAVPFYGGTIPVGALQVAVPFAVGGTSGGAGAGALALPATLPALPALSGASIFLEAALAAATAVFGVSLTQGLELEVG